MTRSLAATVRDITRLEGDFTLRSGQKSNVYWDKYRTLLRPDLLRNITSHLNTLLPWPDEYQRLAGLETGAITLLTALILDTGVPGLIVRKAPKTYGSCQQIEGTYNAFDRVVLLEDVVTTGGAVVNAIHVLRDAGLVIDTVVCLVDREMGGADAINNQGCAIYPLFTQSELLRA